MHRQQQTMKESHFQTDLHPQSSILSQKNLLARRWKPLQTLVDVTAVPRLTKVYPSFKCDV